MWNPATREARSQSRSRRVTCSYLSARNDRFNERFALSSPNGIEVTENATLLEVRILGMTASSTERLSGDWVSARATIIACELGQPDPTHLRTETFWR